MDYKQREEFDKRVRAVMDALSEYANCRREDGPWFERDLDGTLRKEVEKLLSLGVIKRKLTDSGHTKFEQSGIPVR